MLPQINPFTFGDEPANAGDTVGLQCMVTKGDAPVNITWTLDRKLVKDAPGISIIKMGPKASGLTIESVSAEHRGVFTCFAENAAGYSNHSAKLDVNGIIHITT